MNYLTKNFTLFFFYLLLWIQFHFPKVNKKKLGFLKNDYNGNFFIEFVGLRSKMYAMSVEDRTKAKGVNKSVTKKL